MNQTVDHKHLFVNIVFDIIIVDAMINCESRRHMTKQEREEKERIEYERRLNSRVNAIIECGKRDGKTYTEYDRMRLLAHQDERNYSDSELMEEFDRIDLLEKRDKKLEDK